MPTVHDELLETVQAHDESFEPFASGDDAQEYLQRLRTAVEELPVSGHAPSWESLGEESQKWYEAATIAVEEQGKGENAPLPVPGGFKAPRKAAAAPRKAAAAAPPAQEPRKAAAAPRKAAAAPRKAAAAPPAPEPRKAGRKAAAAPPAQEPRKAAAAPRKAAAASNGRNGHEDSSAAILRDYLVKKEGRATLQEMFDFAESKGLNMKEPTMRAARYYIHNTIASARQQHKWHDSLR